MGKKGSKRGNSSKDFWEGLQGWKQVPVGDDLLLGADEYGFCGLEELDASTLGNLIIPGVPAGAEAADDPGNDTKAPDGVAVAAPQPRSAKKKQGKKRKEPDASADVIQEAEGWKDEAIEAARDDASEGGESVEALKQQLKALQAENKQLKKKQKKEARLEKRAASAAKRKEERAARQAAKLEAAAAAAAEAAAAQPRVDISAWRELQLHPSIESAIARLGFEAPTHVQAECLPAAIRNRRDIIGAAQTGSGKTLAFGLPIMQLLLQEREAQQAQQQEDEHQEAKQQEQQQEEEGEEEEGKEQQQQQGQKVSRQQRQAAPLRALILAPTRELAMQVCDHLQAVGKECGIWVVPIVGGISAQKQERLLSNHPEVVVATPGRLWGLMREGQSHVNNLSGLSFLVIDEADRMVQQGHYGELSSILGAIPVNQQLAEPEAVEPEDEPEAEAAAEVGAGTEARPAEEPDGSGEEGGEEAEEEKEQQNSKKQQQHLQQRQKQGQDGSQRQPKGARLQTFVFSATLTLPAKLRKRLRKGGGGASGSSDLDSLMDRIPFRGKPKIVDLTSQRKLADKVEEAYIVCGDAERDEYLYCLLAKHPGRTIVFVNAISSVRRLAAILKLLGLPAQPLHAGMQQRQRLKALDRFRDEHNAVLVATDVAARGLDIKDVRCVVHYQLPASVDVYVHRSGRTARAEAEGLSVALVTPKENARFLALLKAMGRGEPPEFPLDLSLMPAVHRRVRLAVRLDELERRQSKKKAEQSWRAQHAEQLGIELSDEDEDEEGGAEGRRQGKKARRERSGKRGPGNVETAAEVRAELAALLAEPLQPRFSRKWFTGGAAAAVMAAMDPSAAAASGGGKKKKQKHSKTGAAAEGGQGGAAGVEEAQALAGEATASAADPPTARTVNQAVALAQQRSDSRSKVAQQVAAKQQRRGGQAQQQAADGGKKGGKKKQAQDPRAAALQAALSKAMAGKLGKKGGGSGGRMLVIPQALGRDAAGPDALQTLRQKLAGL